MAHFSRLTDIVTCNLSSILAAADDPRITLDELVDEMQQGVAGAKRSMKTARDNEENLRSDMAEHQLQVEDWTTQARDLLTSGDEEGARSALFRKRELTDLIAGLEQNLQAAVATREHLTTTYRALEARLSEAKRRSSVLSGATSKSTDVAIVTDETSTPTPTDGGIDDELAALKRELGQK